MMLMQSMAQELAPFRIRVNGIAPGAVRTPINTLAWNTREAYEALMTLVPYKRIGEPEDIARAAVWLASDASDYVTGTTLFVDGGMTLYPGFSPAAKGRVTVWGPSAITPSPRRVPAKSSDRAFTIQERYR